MTWNYYWCILCALSGLETSICISDRYVKLLIGLSFWIITIMPVCFMSMCGIYKSADKTPVSLNHFAECFFAIAKDTNPFLLIGFEQNHEQQNKELKIHGENLSLNDECIFIEWSVAGPAIVIL